MAVQLFLCLQFFRIVVGRCFAFPRHSVDRVEKARHQDPRSEREAGERVPAGRLVSELRGETPRNRSAIGEDPVRRLGEHLKQDPSLRVAPGRRDRHGGSSGGGSAETGPPAPRQAFRSCP